MDTTANQQSTFVAPVRRDRWLGFLIVTIVLNFITLHFLPMFAKDIVTPMQLLVCLAPAGWGLFTLFASRTRKEHIVGYISIVPFPVWVLGAATLAWQNGWSWT